MSKTYIDLIYQYETLEVTWEVLSGKKMALVLNVQIKSDRIQTE